jgi:L-threonylcarbamoyladenylate synthase
MKTRCEILAPTKQNRDRCADYLRKGEVIGLPTETVYGLAGNALCETTVRKIFEIKGRPYIDPLIVHFKSIESAAEHVHLSDFALKLAGRFWPGALTLVVPKRSRIPDIVTAGLPSVAVRIPGHPVFRSLLDALDFPLAAPSANPFGYVSPTCAEHVQTHLGRRIFAVLDGGACLHGVESTILDLRDPRAPVILRPGPISAEALSITDSPARKTKTEANTKAQSAPGMLTQHYSPHTPVQLFAHAHLPEASDSSTAVVFNKKPQIPLLAENHFWLSEDGSLAEIAHNLFRLIQKLDSADYALLKVECAPNEGIGIAVNDRLSRAAAKRPG